MPRTHRRFSREVKMQIVEAIINGAAVSDVAKANELHPELARKWVREFRKSQVEAFSGKNLLRSENARIAQLERQLGQMAAEQIALKKALRRIKELAREKSG